MVAGAREEAETTGDGPERARDAKKSATEMYSQLRAHYDDHPSRCI